MFILLPVGKKELFQVRITVFEDNHFVNIELDQPICGLIFLAAVAVQFYLAAFHEGAMSRNKSV